VALMAITAGIGSPLIDALWSHMSASDRRSLPTPVLNLYLYALMVWGIALLSLFLTGYIAYGIPACYLLWVWQAGVTLYWGRFLIGEVNEGRLGRDEVDAGARSVGKILTSSALLPAILFLGQDPLDPRVISTCIGACLVSAIAWGFVSALGRFSNRYAHIAALTLACLALPINTSGAVTVATFVGVWDAVVEVAPTPERSNERKRPVKGPQHDR